MSLDTALEEMSRLVQIIKMQEEALFKIACGCVGDKELHRADMRDIAEESLPKALQELVLSLDRKGEHAKDVASKHKHMKKKKADI